MAPRANKPESDPPDDLLKTVGLVKKLGGKVIVDGVDLRCASGEVVGLLGPNGAGKTTTLRCCYGFLTPNAGTVHIAGHDLVHEPDAAMARLGVCTQDDTFDPDFTVRGNLRQQARYLRPRAGDEAPWIEELLERFGLAPYGDARPYTLSGGYKRRLLIARALVHRPRLVFLDEPTTGLDPEARVGVWELIDQMRREGLGIVLTTHYMDEAERLADRLVVLRRGQVASEGPVKTVLGNLVGEHILVVDGTASEAVEAWCADQALPDPSTVLGERHLACTGAQLAAFASHFPELRYEVRKPTLDDLFLALAREGRGDSGGQP
jgi:lipooligosaccharide transport system ATP-binding protein